MKKKKVSDFQREFDATKPLIRERSQGFCELFRVFESRMGTRQSISEGEPLAEEARLLARIKKEICSGLATHVHHRKYRSRGGTNSPDNLIHICMPCHTWTHANPELSSVLGLSLHAYESEEL